MTPKMIVSICCCTTHGTKVSKATVPVAYAFATNNVVNQAKLNKLGLKICYQQKQKLHVPWLIGWHDNKEDC
jgi:hypothetical protein